MTTRPYITILVISCATIFLTSIATMNSGTSKLVSHPESKALSNFIPSSFIDLGLGLGLQSVNVDIVGSEETKTPIQAEYIVAYSGVRNY